MEITSIKIPNGNNVYLFENFYPDDLLLQLTKICNNFNAESDDWQVASWTNKRYNFKHIEYFNELLFDFYENFSCDMESILNNKIAFEESVMWIDLPGLGKLQPHVEGPAGGTYLMQIYLSDRTEPFNGTTIYNDNKEVLLQLPFRNNFGWMFDQATGVMHGRHSDVSPNLKRFNIMTRFR